MRQAQARGNGVEMIFTIEGGELTPTLKLKRKEIYTKYKDTIEELYMKSGTGLVSRPKTNNGEEQ